MAIQGIRGGIARKKVVHRIRLVSFGLWRAFVLHGQDKVKEGFVVLTC